MTCKAITTALGHFTSCEDTEDGSRIQTHCLYPSFQPVAVFVAKYGEGYKVHDGGGAARVAWDHAKDAQLINRMIARYARKFDVSVLGDSIIADVPNKEWLLAAILSVANASASAANATVERAMAHTEKLLIDKIYTIISHAVPAKTISKEFSLSGKSGKIHHFDFAIQRSKDNIILINAVSPHHVSISAKYVAFSDARIDIGRIAKLAVYEKKLDVDDIALIQQVADLVPIKSLEMGVRRELAH